MVTNSALDLSSVGDIVPMVANSVNELLPYGIGLMAIFIGVSVIPKIIYKFF